MGFGILCGLLLPLLTFLVLYIIFQEFSSMNLVSTEGFSEGFRFRTLSLIGIASNAILLQYFRKRYAFNTVRGITIPTFIYIIAWLIYFSTQIL